MNRKLPIRTYQRKTVKKPFVTSLALSFISSTNCNFVEKQNVDDSLNYDPFETTFDRIAKEAVLPPRPLNTDENDSWQSTSSESDIDNLTSVKSTNFLISSTQNSAQVDHKLARTKNKKDAVQEMAISTGKLTKRTRMMSINDERQPEKVQGQKKKKKIQKKKELKNKLKSCTDNKQVLDVNTLMHNSKSASYENGVSYNNNDERLYQNVKKIDEKIMQTESIKMNESTASLKYIANYQQIKPCFVKLDSHDVQNYILNCEKFSENQQNIQCDTNADKNIIKVQNTTLLSPEYNDAKSFKDMQIKSCSVVLNDIVENKYLESKRNVRNIKDISNMSRLVIYNPSEIGTKNQIKKHFINVERLKIKKFIKESDIVFNKEKENIFSSTPIRKQVEHINLVTVSPIISNINDDLHLNQEYSLIVTKKSPTSTSNFAIENEVTSCKDNDHVIVTQRHKSEISYLLSISPANTDQSPSLFGNTIYNRSSNDTNENNREKKNVLAATNMKDILVESCLEQKRVPTDREESDENLQYTSPSKICTASENNISDNHVLLTRLQDSIRIGKRMQYPKWQLSMSNISDSLNIEATQLNNEMYYCAAKDKNLSPSHSTYNLEHSKSFSDMPLYSKINAQVEKSVFLKPGKQWTRSLSILSNINKKSDLDKLSIGKGKNWRHSVRNILDMQQQGLSQCCTKNRKDDKTNLHNDTSTIVSMSNSNMYKELNLMNSSRFFKRISTRVVLNNTNLKSDIKDTPFLEAFGIITEKSPNSNLSYRKESSIHDEISNHSTTVKDVVLQKCSQNHYVSFADRYPDLYLEHCRKIGEGVYGEVFLYEHNDIKSVIKIIPIENEQLVNGEPQKKFNEVLSEIVIAKELDDLKLNNTYKTNGFVHVKNISCIIGKYPEKLIELWNVYDNEKTSDNDCPSMFGENQLYIVFELDHGGEDLEAFIFQTAEEAYSLFLQIALALAVAEKAFEFEHRDLHWGNVLVSRTKELYTYYTLGEKKIKFPNKGVKVSVIDYTLSRMLYEGCCIYNDLALDPVLFTAHGDYQFEIYRLMRDKIENNWQKFEPYTNILWLHYILDKMITMIRYKKTNLKVHKKNIIKLKNFKDSILNYSSAYDFINNSDNITYL
ncbi:hypothetical protein PUN28_002892 [Cardiocondyla obscurior]|uniref:non-specific serine/threonine protein kinase n=1 Tax=Cardiocondyla obscurior TaxID=286306 RepID=A0AAW2GWI2_9HYME